MNSNKKPLVSIVVPSYNHEKYVKQTIKSIINQTYENIELIVIDDGSTDGSINIVKKLSQKYHFKFIHRPNKGLSATLNEGINISQGKYYCTCASDDVFKLDKIEKQVKFMEENNEYGMCYGKVILLTDECTKIPLNIELSRGGWIFNDLIRGRFWIPSVSSMIRMDVFTDIGLYDENLYVEDWDMWVRISNKYQVGYINKYLAYYRQHETNISKKGWKLYESKVASLKKWQEIEGYDVIIKIWKLKWFRVLSKHYKAEAKKYLPLALKNILHKNSLIGIIKYYFMK